MVQRVLLGGPRKSKTGPWTLPPPRQRTVTSVVAGKGLGEVWHLSDDHHMPSTLVLGWAHQLGKLWVRSVCIPQPSVSLAVFGEFWKHMVGCARMAVVRSPQPPTSATGGRPPSSARTRKSTSPRTNAVSTDQIFNQVNKTTLNTLLLVYKY